MAARTHHIACGSLNLQNVHALPAFRWRYIKEVGHRGCAAQCGDYKAAGLPYQGIVGVADQQQWHSRVAGHHTDIAWPAAKVGHVDAIEAAINPAE